MEQDSSEQTKFKQIAEWSEDEVAQWMGGLGSSLEEYISQFLAHCICGEDLLKLNRQKLEYLQVTQIGHQELFLEAVELLSRMDTSINNQSFVTLGATLSKKASQLLRLLLDGDGSIDASHLEHSAAVMSSAKCLISWLDRSPTMLIEDYNTFRKLVLMNSMQVTSALSEVSEESECDGDGVCNGLMGIIRATAVMIAPEVLSSSQPPQLVHVTLTPDNQHGLGISMEKTGAGLLVIKYIQPGSPADLHGKVFAGDEVVQVNDQNVIGWEVVHVIECLKANEFQVDLILKCGSHVANDDGDNYVVSEGEGVTTEDDTIVTMTTTTTVRTLSTSSNNSSCRSGVESGSGYTSPPIQDLDEATDVHFSRQLASPLSDASSHSSNSSTRSKKSTKGFPKNFFIPPPPPKEDFPAVLREKKLSMDDGMVQPYSIVSFPLRSNSSHVVRGVAGTRGFDEGFEPEHDYDEPPLELIAEMREHKLAELRMQSEPPPNMNSPAGDRQTPVHKQKMPQISYKTQVVGGVVHRIPITAGAYIEGEPSLGSESPKQSRGSIKLKKKPLAKPKQPSMLSSKLTKRPNK